MKFKRGPGRKGILTGTGFQVISQGEVQMGPGHVGGL